jgi:hypothetical protein
VKNDCYLGIIDVNLFYIFENYASGAKPKLQWSRKENALGQHRQQLQLFVLHVLLIKRSYDHGMKPRLETKHAFS